jgi:hypothetical protein
MRVGLLGPCAATYSGLSVNVFVVETKQNVRHLRFQLTGVR